VVIVDIVPFNHLGAKNCEMPGRMYKLGEVEPYRDEEVEAINETLKSCGLKIPIV
jgi:hypothetical protein